MSAPIEQTYALGFVGLGAVGQSMATHLAAAPGELYVYDLRSEAMDALTSVGAVACSSPAEVAGRASIVFVSLPSPEIVLECLSSDEGLLAGAAMRTFVDLSTSGTEMAATVAAMLADRGIGYLDAPVSGGPQGARNARLTIMAAGASELFRELEPLLSRIGSNVLHVGEVPGQGQLTKVINNQLSATAMAATGEALALGVRGGLDPVRLLGAINLSSGRNTATEDKYPRCVVTRTFDYGFRLRLMAKDTALCLREAARLDFPMSIGAAVQDAWAEADAAGNETDDFTVIAQLFERRAGVRIASPESP
jgi:3-hydroxyisobutyrate dehydrogenase-like beta-hydroxyacid dehydrogenase